MEIRTSQADRTVAATSLGNAPRRAILATSADWTISEHICTAGPRDRPFEEQHDRVSLALVTAGTFQYRTDAGEAILYPGAFLLGNAGACFECSHAHSVGDRCVAVDVSRHVVGDVAATAAGSSRFRFRTPVLPAGPELASLAIWLQLLPLTNAPLAIDESVYSLIETVVSTLRTSVPSTTRLAASDVRRVSAVLHYIEARSSTALELAELAAIAMMSKYHFLRTFRRVTGTTPYRYVLETRLRRAASALVETRLPVGAIALNEGFDDLSSFNRFFRRVMNMTPTQYRLTCRCAG